MKILKGLSFLAVSAILLVSCFEEPEYSDTPVIEFRKLEFVDVPNPGSVDSLILQIDFKDGNGDLGISSENTNNPFHQFNYHLENGGGNLTPISTTKQFSDLPDFIVPEGAIGKLVTNRTRNKPGYDFLPLFNQPGIPCQPYKVVSITVPEYDADILSDDLNITDTLSSNEQTFDVYIVADTFYTQKNPNYSNIEIDWLIKEGDNFRVIDWENEIGCVSFDGRFPILVDSERALEGTIKYRMVSTGFLIQFGTNTLKLRIKIRDRALNESNIIETDAFTFDSIRKK